MAGSSVTQTRTSNFRKVKGRRPTRVTVTMACVSDDANGLVPNETTAGLSEYALQEILPVPDTVAPFTSPFEIRIDDSDGNPVYKSGQIEVDDVDPISGSDASGNYALMEDSNVFKIVDPSDSESTLSVGNSKEASFQLVFKSLTW
jgi:hypothetical protein